MAQQSQSAESLVRERRLRPVYELLDSGNNKKVISEVDKLLKKTPNFVCAKVLKALALIRLCKIEEGRELLNNAMHENPTDDAAIQAASICYKELDDPVTLCAVLEAACKKEQSEELLTHWFMAQVRLQDYQKQHLTALNLYKMFGKASYFAWAIGSYIVKYERNIADNKGVDLLPIKLSERMCDKYIAEAEQGVKIDTNVLSLYFSTLEKLGKYETLLKVFGQNGYPQTPWNNDHFHDMYCRTLAELSKTSELFDYLRSTYMAHPTEYDLLKQIITRFGKTQRESVQTLMDDLVANRPGREVALADLLFCRTCFDLQEVSSRIGANFRMAIKYGADKLSFHSELFDYFKYIGGDLAKELMVLMHPHYSDTEENYNTPSKIIFDVNFEMLNREIVPVNTSFERMLRADRCFGKYLVCEQTKEAIRGEENLKTKESEFHDQFIVIAASSLIAEYCCTISNKEVNGFALDMIENKRRWLCNEDHPKELKELRNRMDPGTEVTDALVKFFDALSVDQKLTFKDRIFVLMTAILLLEYGLQRSPHNHSFRILLAKSYSRLGASLSSCRVISQLDLKHVQWDSLGYLTLFETVSGGLYQEGLKNLTLAENMYSTYKRESMEHVITAYKYGTFVKIPEFLGFRDQLLDSTQCGLVFCERRLLEYLISSNTSADLKKVAESVSRDLHPSLLEKTKFTDNRDFTVLQCLAENIDLKGLQEKSAEMDILFYKIRISLLFSLTKLVNFLGNLDNQKEKAVIIKMITMYDDHVAKCDELFGNDEPSFPDTPLFHGIWPHRCQKYRDLGCLMVLKKMLCYIRALLTSEEIEEPSWEGMKAIMLNFSTFILNQLVFYNNTEHLSALPELAIDASFAKLHYILETFSFMRIILECAIKIDKHRLNIWKQDTKKKGRVAVLTGHKKLHSECIRILHERTRGIVTYVDEFREKMKNYTLQRQSRSYDSCEVLLRPGFMFKAVAELHPVFFENVEESLRVQTEEIRKVAQSLSDYIKHLDP